MEQITRRTALFTVGLAATPGFGRNKATAFALIEDRYHNSDYIRTALSKTLGKEEGLSIDFCDDVTRMDAEGLQGYKLLIVFRDGMLWPNGYADENSNAAYVRAGSPRIMSDPPLQAGGKTLCTGYSHNRGPRSKSSLPPEAACFFITTPPTSARTTMTCATFLGR